MRAPVGLQLPPCVLCLCRAGSETCMHATSVSSNRCHLTGRTHNVVNFCLIHNCNASTTPTRKQLLSVSSWSGMALQHAFTHTRSFTTSVLFCRLMQLQAAVQVRPRRRNSVKSVSAPLAAVLPCARHQSWAATVTATERLSAVSRRSTTATP